MYGISIEDAAERIVDPRTRSYFQEVLQTYVNGNYRSAIVMLWTVVICDLVYKLRTLAEVSEHSFLTDDRSLQVIRASAPLEWYVPRCV